MRKVPGNAKSAYQPMSFQMWLCARWPSSCAMTTVTSRGVNSLDDRVPEDDAAARPEPGRLGVRQRRHVVHVLDDDRDVADVLDSLEPRRRRAQLRVVQPMRREEIRIDEREEQREADEASAPRQPTRARGSLRARPMTIASARQRKTNCAAEREPVAEDVADVADVRQMVPALPPEVGDAERQLHRPDEREAEHAEQHSRAEPARPPTRARTARPCARTPRARRAPRAS